MQTPSHSQMKLKLPGGTVTIGPGTVPSSPAGAERTSIEEVIKISRRISEEGFFDDLESEDEHRTR